MIKPILLILAGVFLLSYLFNVLFKVGIMAILILGILYLIKRVFFE